ncbi:hypothetical protein CVT24_007988 [Panaeolus cyanescens]|uniref:Prolyl 4-hydroxylase alpha subunit domain-containing protein n=1 Tax=Panaeolus cyanescens TaxID=181874 RepID=A0A409YQT6_9AGAR|nr:hypothetical protein CVT24_007988 [Panaeolus cyanescens]
MSPSGTPINFSETCLASVYSGFYATVLDDIFSEEECTSLVSLATRNGSWIPAGLSAEGPSQTVHKNFRNSDRILVVHEDTADLIYTKLKPFIELQIGRIAVGDNWDSITGKKGRKQGPTWKLTSVNPRLSFLRYGPGHYFKQHCDGLNDLTTESGKVLKSFVTLHIYLNGTGDSAPHQSDEDLIASQDYHPSYPVEGGATRFWTPDKKHYLDVLPKRGRVLIFQQRMLIHSGEEVTHGTKYTIRSDFMFEEI